MPKYTDEDIRKLNKITLKMNCTPKVRQKKSNFGGILF